MRILSGIVGIALLGIGGAALADEPVRLDAASLDSVTAGLWRGVAVSRTLPARATGASLVLYQGSYAGVVEQVTIKPGSVSGDYRALAISETSVGAVGIGNTSASGGGRVFTTVSAN